MIPSKPIDDDASLLDEMQSYQESCASIFKPTNYWTHRSADVLKAFDGHSLKEIRSLEPSPGSLQYNLHAFKLLEPLQDDCLNHNSIAKELAQLDLGPFQRNIFEAHDSGAGFPRLFYLNGWPYTLTWLYYYQRYLIASSFLNLDNSIVVEIGPGSGKQAALLAIYHPDCTIVLFDISPQLYFCNQYLKAALPARRFREWRNCKGIKSLADIDRGVVHLLHISQLGILASSSYGLLWNAASFQEMEPEIVQCYSRLFGHPEYIYLFQEFSGQIKAQSTSRRGVLEPMRIDDYAEILHDYFLNSVEPSRHIFCMNKPFGYQDTVWRLKEKAASNSSAELHELLLRVVRLRSLINDWLRRMSKGAH